MCLLRVDIPGKIVVNIIAGGTKVNGQLSITVLGPHGSYLQSQGVAYAWVAAKRIFGLAGAISPTFLLFQELLLPPEVRS
jgi:hypothetical protein